MPIDALDPTKPVLTDPVLITEELRAIKQRLLADKNAIASLQSTLVVLSGIGAFGEATMALPTLAAWATLVQQSAIGKTIFEAANVGVIQTLLSITSPNATVSTGTNKVCITLPGGVKIQVGRYSVVGTGQRCAFQTSFSTVVYGVFATMAAIVSGFPTVEYSTITLSDVFVDTTNSGTYDVYLLAIGI